MSEQLLSKIYAQVLEPERSHVRRSVDDIKRGVATVFILNLFAPKGFGKTVSLEQIWKEYEQVLPTCLVRVSDFFTQNNAGLALRYLLIFMIRELGERLPGRVFSLPSDYGQWTNEEQFAELLLEMVQRTKDYEKMTVILIDDYDLISEEQRRWFQETFLSPASRIGKLAVVLTSETELRFTENFELRMRVESRALRGLDSPALSRALPEFASITEQIHRITGGWPAPTERFVEQLRVFQVKTFADLQDHAQELTGKYYRAYVEDKILGGLDADIRETMLVLALLRRFDVQVLKKILPELLSMPYENYSTTDYLELIERLRPWVEWRRQGGYALNLAFRLMVEGYVSVIRPDLFKRVNRATENLYRKWLATEYREHYLVELLYHVLAQAKAEANGLFVAQNEIIQAKVGDVLLEYLTGGGGRRLQDVDSVIALRNSLEHDTELANYISEDVRRKIDELIDQRSKEAKTIIPFQKAV